MAVTPKGLSDEKAARMMVALRGGGTLNKFGVKAPRLEAYFNAHPEYALEARALIEANAKAALLRKGARLRSQTHCKHGHSLANARCFYQRTDGYLKRDCRTCGQIRHKRAGFITPQGIIEVKKALQNGATIGQIIHGRPTGGGAVNRSLKIVDTAAFYRYRRENPGFDSLILDAIGSRIRRPTGSVDLNTYKYDWSAGDELLIRSMVPERLADRDDIVNDVIVSLLEGRLNRAQVESHIKRYVSARYTAFPRKFAKFAGRPLLSLDEVLFDDGTATRGDTISRGLWD